jgi:RNA polymerase sigma factor (sigma-70 family)
MANGHQLLADYVQAGSEEAFRELVEAYIDLVYSAALRLLNNDTHLAEDVAQTVFADLARLSRGLSPKVMLGGWLHRHTCFVARNTLRKERRRQLREQQAAEMKHEDHAGVDLALLAPILDEAIDQLAPEDRTAIILRFFEQREFHEIGTALGSHEEAARKRVNRALDKLQVRLKRRGVALSVAAVGSAMAAHAVTAAPAGLAAGIAANVAAGTAVTSATSLTILKIMGLTKLKIGAAVALAVAVATPLLIQHHTQTKLHQENQALQLRLARLDQLVAENQRLSNLVAQAAPAAAAPPTNRDPAPEVLRLRGEVGRLRQEQASDLAARKTNTPLNSITSSPEMVKLIRMQQKAGMTMIYKDFAKRSNLPPEQAEKLNDLLADHVMQNIDRITEVLREGKTQDEIDQVFKQQEASLQEQVQGLLGPELLRQYQEYTRNLASYLTAEQFKPLMTANPEAREQQSKQLYDLMQEETQSALARAGLSPDFQVVPSLNFRNIASEEYAEKSLKLLDEIYDGVSARVGSFLSPEDLKKFAEFRATAINANRAGLTMNRKMMAPTSR